MTNLFFDIICYAIVVMMFIAILRVTKNKRVKISFAGKTLEGHVLAVQQGLNGRIGLLNTPCLNPGDGILLKGSKSIHTVGMNMAIDLVFLDDSNRFIGKMESVQPGNKKINGPAGTKSILELGTGTIAKYFDDVPSYTKVEIEHHD